MAELACIVWGSSGPARVLRDLLDDLGGHIVALVDRDPQAVSVVEGAPVLAGQAGLSGVLEHGRANGPAAASPSVARAGPTGARCWVFSLRPGWTCRR